MKKLIVLLGTTASGKTEISLKLVEKLKEMGFSSEIISSDSVQIYKKLDIGSAKPSRSILRKIPQNLVDIIDPDQKYSCFFRFAWILDATQLAINSMQRKNSYFKLYVRSIGLWCMASILPACAIIWVSTKWCGIFLKMLREGFAEPISSFL